MKFLTLIFSLYFLALAIMPCSDTKDCKYQETEPSTFATTGHSDHDNDTEHCSPFCICSCCSSTVTLKNAFFSIKNIKPTDRTRKFPIQDFSFVSKYYGNIWQPPKIS